MGYSVYVIEYSVLDILEMHKHSTLTSCRYDLLYVHKINITRDALDFT